jgi:hypothetical protein
MLNPDGTWSRMIKGLSANKAGRRRRKFSKRPDEDENNKELKRC